MTSAFVRLSTPCGSVYLRKDAIVAFSRYEKTGPSQTQVKSQVWMAGQDDPFNIHEDVETICRLFE